MKPSLPAPALWHFIQSSELSSMKSLANHLALLFLQMIQMLPILYGILGLSHWMRRHRHFQLYEFVGNSVVSCPKLQSGGPPCHQGPIFLGGRLVPSLKKTYILKHRENCKLTGKVGSQNLFTTEIK